MIQNKEIHWKVRFKGSPSKVYNMLTTDDGRALFWAESAIESDNHIHFKFPSGIEYVSEIREKVIDKKFRLDYFGGEVTFDISVDINGFTILSVFHQDVATNEIAEVNAGWVSVLMTLKAACEGDLDLRNHNPNYSWDQHFVGN